MRVVFGDAPLARALAAHLSGRGPVVLATPTPVEGPWLWRRADPASGAGVRGIVESARAVFVVPAPGERVDGLLLVLARTGRVRGVLATGLGEPLPSLPAGCEALARLAVGPTWGPEEPLVAAWARGLARGARVWVADPGTVRPVPMDAAVAACAELVERPSVRWTLAGDQAVALPELADELARGLGVPGRVRRVPLAWAAWRAGLPSEHLLAWTRVPEATTTLDGWHPPTRGRAAWLGNPGRWRAPPHD